MMANSIRRLVQINPQLHDLVQLHKRRFSEEPDPLYILLDRFSESRGAAARFISVGVGDGLLNDPLREFILRDDWRGILVEPEPVLFRTLMKHYPARRFPNLRLVRAAVTAREDAALQLFTLKETALSEMEPEQRRACLALASLDHARLLEALPAAGIVPSAIYAVEVPLVTVETLARNFFEDRNCDLLLLDAGGHEQQILGAIDFELIRPELILFRGNAAEESRAPITRRLVQAGYAVRPIGGLMAASLV